MSMREHDWLDNPNGTITCRHCGLTRALAFGRHKPRGACPKAPTAAPSPPGLFRKAANFAAAALRQAPLFVEAALTGDEAAAFRSVEEIERIAAICKACPLFNGEVCTHKNCGCAISADRPAFLSKLAWRSQRCPDDPPKWGGEQHGRPAPEAPAEIPPRWPPADEWLLYVPPGAGIQEAAYLLSRRAPAGMMHDRIFEVFYRLDHTEYDRLVLCIVGGEQMESAAVELRCSTTGHIGPRWSSGPLSPGASTRPMTLKSDDGRLGDVLAEPAS